MSGDLGFLLLLHLLLVVVFISQECSWSFQALVLATRHQAIKDANLHGRNLNALRDVLMRQYQQVGPSEPLVL